MRNNIALVMVTFGRHQLLEITLKTLFQTIDAEHCSVTIIDNGSEADVTNLLMQHHRKINNLILLNNNRGKPYAWNLGAHVAMEECIATKVSNPNYFLFCDSDLSFRPDWHKVLVESYEDHKDLPLCGLSGMLWPPHKENGIEHKGRRRTVWESRFPSGCCILMSTDAFAKNGMWDTRRLIRTVDTSYFRNAINRGYVNASVDNTVISHTGGKNRTWNISTGEPKYLR